MLHHLGQEFHGPAQFVQHGVMGPAVAQFPAVSQTNRAPVAALGSSVPAPTAVESEKAASL